MLKFYGEIEKEKKKYPKMIQALREMLAEEEAYLALLFMELWKQQQENISMQEYRKIAEQRKLPSNIEKEILKTYSIFVLGKVLSKETVVMERGAKEALKKKPSFSFDIKYHLSQKWIEKNCIKQIKDLTDMQKKAVQTVIVRAERLGMTADATANLLQPMIGLHKGQATANLNYYNNVKQNLLKNHPRMKEETAEKKALEQAKKYAQKQKEYRAATIARTELVRAYNAGEYYGIKQAQYEGLLGKVKKFAVSAGDGGVCKGCREIEGTLLELNEPFVTEWGNVLFPPFHTSCRCAVEYEEIENAVSRTEFTDNTQQQGDFEEEGEKFREIQDKLSDIAEKVGNDLKSFASGEKLTSYDELPENVTKSFEEGLKNADTNVKTLLEKEMKKVSYAIDKERIAYNRKWDYIKIKEDVSPSAMAHELFHRIDNKYNVTKNHDFKKELQKDFKDILLKSEKYGGVAEYLRKNYANMFRDLDNLMVWEEYRGVSDIFSGLSIDKLNFGYRHDREYWLKDTTRLSKEAWSQYGSVFYRNDEEVIKVFKELFPNFYESAIIVAEELI